MKMASLIFIFSLVFGLTSQAASTECTSDFLMSQTNAPNHLTAAQLSLLQQLADSGEAEKGWETLAGYGDQYAVFASKIVEKSVRGRPDLFENMLAVHWEVSNNKEIFEKYSEPYAAQHFRQYVQILQTGVWPDSDQILNSYLAAARKFNLPEDTVLVAVWMSSCMHGLLPWQKAIRLPKDRSVARSNACMKISELDAAWIIFQDSTGIFLRSIGGLFE